MIEARKIIPAIATAATLTIAAGAGYIVDCRLNDRDRDIERCWMTGLAIAGIGGVGGGSFKLGYETLNPNLKSPFRAPERDPGGRFVKRGKDDEMA